MKQIPFINSLLSSAFIIVFTVLSSCSSDRSKEQAGAEHSETESEAQKTEIGNPKFQDEKIKAVYDHYIHVKNALIKSDVKEVQSGAAELQTALQATGNTTGAEIAGKIASESKIEMQRANFDTLTSEVEQVIKSTKLASGKIFKQFCPMAKNGDGAYWLASESDIKNPYFGNDMLECGEVREEIK